MNINLSPPQRAALRKARNTASDVACDLLMKAMNPLMEGALKASRLAREQSEGRNAAAVRETDRHRVLFRVWVRSLLLPTAIENTSRMHIFYGSARNPLEGLKGRALETLESFKSGKLKKPEWMAREQKMSLDYFFNVNVHLREGDWRDLSPDVRDQLTEFIREQSRSSDFLKFPTIPAQESRLPAA